MVDDNFDLTEWLTGWLCGMVGRLIFVKKIHDEPVIPDLPAVPEAAMYLYGTPNESGNIGLRNGDSVTYYEGVVAPPIDTVWTVERKETHPYAVYFNSGSSESLHLLRTVEYANTLTGERALKLPSRNDVDELCYKHKNGEWVYVDTSNAVSLRLVLEYLKWTSFDLINEDGTVYLPASMPIPVSGVVDEIDGIPIYE